MVHASHADAKGYGIASRPGRSILRKTDHLAAGPRKNGLIFEVGPQNV